MDTTTGGCRDVRRHIWPPECVIVTVISPPGAGKKKEFLLMKACCAAARDVMSDVSKRGRQRSIESRFKHNLLGGERSLNICLFNQIITFNLKK